MATQIKLPKDAEGREVPLDTEVMYDANGKKCASPALRTDAMFSVFGRSGKCSARILGERKTECSRQTAFT